MLPGIVSRNSLSGAFQLIRNAGSKGFSLMEILKEECGYP
jgi:hypothetical protein